MNLYWSSRENTAAPPGAVFAYIPFCSAVSLKGPINRIDALPCEQTVRVVRRRFLPERKEWMAMVGKALQAIQKGEMEKVVLARCTILECDSPPNPFALAAAIQKKGKGTTLFCLSDGDTAFLGATPEKLFSRKGNRIESEAMAGTRPRGKTAPVDAHLEQELFLSEKDLLEESHIQTYLRQKLSPLCAFSLTFSHLSVYKTDFVQHLYSRCKGQLKEGVSDAHLLEALHPTPALCGFPKERALSLIRELEPFDRGLYGGVIGWSTPEASDWAVAIRSCLLKDSTAYLYAGAGIVAGSQPALEWEELDLKTKLYEGVFV